MEMVDNLTTLPDLDEPNMLQSLNARYMKNLIYTRTGPILVALNPWQVILDAILTAGLLCTWLWHTPSPSLCLNGTHRL